MFWRFGGYGNIATIDTILDRPEFTLEELLDEADLIQELKNHNAKLVDYLREENVLARLLDYVVAPKLETVATPETAEDDGGGKGKSRALSFSRPRSSSRASDSISKEEEAEKKRNKYAYVAAETLSSENWAICESILAQESLLLKFWSFLKRPAPLDPLQATYFTKVNESLFDKKTIDMIEHLKSLDGAIQDILRHVDCPMIMDLLLKIISLERTEHGQGIVEWLYTQDVIPTLLSFLGPEHSWATQTSAGDFIKAVITVSANASQNEQTCIGPNELTRQLVSQPCVEQLVGYMLDGGNALTVGVGIIIEVIRKNNSDYDPEVGAEANALPSSRDPIYLGNLLRLFAQHVPDFVNLVMNRQVDAAELDSTFGSKIRPLGFDRFKTCELMAELLHCSNMGLLNENGAEELILARDAERMRLRSEGKLLGVRGEQPSSPGDDLTMRVSRSSPADEGHRLEVKNLSDDDGFEEVGHSSDMTEDTSHEYVRAEDEMHAINTASFLDKDGDDFVDEPLTSPKISAADAAGHDQSFEEPDLVVAPLSPTKEKAFEQDDEAPANQDTPVVAEMLDQVNEIIKSQPSVEDISRDPDANDATARVAGLSLTSQQSTTPQSESEGHISAAAKGDGIVPSEHITMEEPAQPSSSESSQHENEALAHVATSEEREDDLARPKDADESMEPMGDDEEAQLEPEQGSVILNPTAPAQHSSPMPSSDTLRPVVGDYLKMQFVEHQVVPTILSFFFSYPWNNFLHNVVYDVVQQVFNGPMDRGFNPTLAVSLFEAADITTQIIRGQQASEESQAKTKTRMGYMGHLTLIAEEVVKFTDRHPPELLSEMVLDKVMTPDWVHYVEGPLAETRERDNAILGGVRPEVAMNNRLGGAAVTGNLPNLASAFGAPPQPGGSSALAEAGLNASLVDSGEGEGVESSGGIPFAISAGTHISGFNNSSDEDEDDEIENDEDIHNEFRAYTDPLNATHNAMDPPSLPPPPPPPPPPLNTPPSRARLQLAARLAMSKRKAAESGKGQDTGDLSSAPSIEPDSRGLGKGGMSGLLQSPQKDWRSRNPFADEEAGEDDDPDGEDEEHDEEDERISRRKNSSGDEEDEDGNGNEEDAEGSGGGGWNRGSWWRDMVRRASRSRSGSGARRRRNSGDAKETFGDGRDDDSDAEVAVNSSESDDEEFGDFAMPEVTEAARKAIADSATASEKASGDAVGETNDDDMEEVERGRSSGFDSEREKVLLKPLPVHPPTATEKSSAFSSLWPFSNVKKENQQQASTWTQDEKDSSNSTPGQATPASSIAGEGEPSMPERKEEPSLGTAGQSHVTAAEDGSTHVVDEDGRRVERAKEARRRTSLEGSDEDDEVGVVI